MKKKIATLLVLVLTLFVGVCSFAACGEEDQDDFEKYNMENYLAEYNFIKITIYEKKWRGICRLWQI